MDYGHHQRIIFTSDSTTASAMSALTTPSSGYVKAKPTKMTMTRTRRNVKMIHPTSSRPPSADSGVGAGTGTGHTRMVRPIKDLGRSLSTIITSNTTDRDSYDNHHPHEYEHGHGHKHQHEDEEGKEEHPNGSAFVQHEYSAFRKVPPSRSGTSRTIALTIDSSSHDRGPLNTSTHQEEQEQEHKPKKELHLTKDHKQRKQRTQKTALINSNPNSKPIRTRTASTKASTKASSNRTRSHEDEPQHENKPKQLQQLQQPQPAASTKPSTNVTSNSNQMSNVKRPFGTATKDQELFLKFSEKNELQKFKYIHNFSTGGDNLFSRMLRERTRIHMKKGMLDITKHSLAERDLYVKVHKHTTKPMPDENRGIYHLF